MPRPSAAEKAALLKADEAVVEERRAAVQAWNRGLEVALAGGLSGMARAFEGCTTDPAFPRPEQEELLDEVRVGRNYWVKACSGAFGNGGVQSLVAREARKLRDLAGFCGFGGSGLQMANASLLASNCINALIDNIDEHIVPSVLFLVAPDLSPAQFKEINDDDDWDYVGVARRLVERHLVHLAPKSVPKVCSLRRHPVISGEGGRVTLAGPQFSTSGDIAPVFGLLRPGATPAGAVRVQKAVAFISKDGVHGLFGHGDANVRARVLLTMAALNGCVVVGAGDKVKETKALIVQCSGVARGKILKVDLGELAPKERSSFLRPAGEWREERNTLRAVAERLGVNGDEFVARLRKLGQLGGELTEAQSAFVRALEAKIKEIKAIVRKVPNLNLAYPLATRVKGSVSAKPELIVLGCVLHDLVSVKASADDGAARERIQAASAANQSATSKRYTFTLQQFLHDLHLVVGPIEPEVRNLLYKKGLHGKDLTLSDLGERVCWTLSKIDQSLRCSVHGNACEHEFESVTGHFEERLREVARELKRRSDKQTVAFEILIPVGGEGELQDMASSAGKQRWEREAAAMRDNEGRAEMSVSDASDVSDVDDGVTDLQQFAYELKYDGNTVATGTRAVSSEEEPDKCFVEVLERQLVDAKPDLADGAFRFYLRQPRSFRMKRKTFYWSGTGKIVVEAERATWEPPELNVCSSLTSYTEDMTTFNLHAAHDVWRLAARRLDDTDRACILNILKLLRERGDDVTEFGVRFPVDEDVVFPKRVFCTSTRSDVQHQQSAFAMLTRAAELALGALDDGLGPIPGVGDCDLHAFRERNGLLSDSRHG